MYHKASLSRSAIHAILTIAGCFMLNNALAGNVENIPLTTTPMPLPGVSLYGLGGDGFTGLGDLLAPLFGQPNSFTFLDPQIYYHNDDTYTGSLGVGHRWLIDNTSILGAYVFGDYNRSNNGHAFWFVSPGMERLGKTLDFSANLYIPVSSENINTGTKFASQTNDFSQVTFSGHSQYDALVNTFESTGYGGDAQVGIRLPFRNSKVYLGGYYFAPKNTSNFGGGEVSFQVPMNDYASIVVSDAYDNKYNNTFKAGLTVWFGGRHTGYHFTGNLTERLVDPIQRNLVAIEGGSHTGEPIVSGSKNTGQTALVASNISFFIPGDSTTTPIGNGTYEDPYQGLSQSNVDDGNAQHNTTFYINSGNYNAYYSPLEPNYIVLNNDQVYGRQDYFHQPAMGSARPLINFANGGFEIPGTDLYDSLTSLQLNGPAITTPGHAGIFVSHDIASNPSPQTVSINDMDIEHFGDGIDLSSSASPSPLSVDVNNSTISNNGGGAELLGVNTEGGIAAFNGSTAPFNLSVVGSEIFDNNYQVTTDSFAVGGLAATNFGNEMNINVVASVISGNSQNLTNGAIVDSVGGIAITNFFSAPVVNLNVSNSSLSGNVVMADEGSDIGAAGGLALFNTATMNVSVSNSIFSNNSMAANDSLTVFNSVGGLAATNINPTSVMNINVINSIFSGNSVAINETGGSNFYAAGGLAAYNNGAVMNINVIASTFSRNLMTVTETAGSTHVYSFGGLAAYNGGTSMKIDVSDSNFSGNLLTAPGLPSPYADGGIAVYNSAGPTTTNVSRSTMTNNDNGIGAYGTDNAITVANSIIAANTVGLTANGGSTIYVSNPRLFDGTVNFDTPGSITFKNLVTQPTTGQHVFCAFGICTVSP